MSDILIAKEIRHQFRAALSTPGLSVEIGGVQTPVACLSVPPAGWVIPESDLPAYFIFPDAEDFDNSAVHFVEHDLQMNVALLARASGDVFDQLDDMQLAVQKALIATPPAVDIARSIKLVRSEPAQNQGGLVIGTRLLKFEISYGSTVGDPSL